MAVIANPTFGFCRTLASHAWAQKGFLEMRGTEVLLNLQCPRCKTIRKDVIHRVTGKVEHRSYVYPDGYMLELDGEVRPSKASLRAQFLDALAKTAKGTVSGVRVQRHLKRVA